jgi:hypothetical protein
VTDAPLRSRRRTFGALALALVLLSGLALAAPVSAAASAPYRLNLYRNGDFVAQTNLVQCVGASMQMMINMMAPKNDRTARTQLSLQNLARKYSAQFGFSDSLVDGTIRQRRGASSRGWSFGLSLLGYGPYRVTSATTMAEAVDVAAIAMRRTGRPVGLLVWQGAHAWVMSGFEATADPFSGVARVTHVFVQDPLYPRGSRTWGPSPKPNTRLSVKQLAADFVPWRPGRGTGMSGRFVLVLPDVQPRPGAGRHWLV